MARSLMTVAVGFGTETAIIADLPKDLSIKDLRHEPKKWKISLTISLSFGKVIDYGSREQGGGCFRVELPSIASMFLTSPKASLETTTAKGKLQALIPCLIGTLLLAASVLKGYDLVTVPTGFAFLFGKMLSEAK